MPPSRRIFSATVVAFVGALAIVAACSKHARHEEPRAPARRVVSLSPSTTEAIFAIGAGRGLIGRSRFCNYPPEAANLPQVGGFIDPNLEAILALRPDLVVGARGPLGPAITERLAEHGAVTYFPPTESIDEIGSMILGLGA